MTTKKKAKKKVAPRIDAAAVAKAAEDTLQYKIRCGAANALTAYMKEAKASDARRTLELAAKTINNAIEEIGAIRHQCAPRSTRWGEGIVWDVVFTGMTVSSAMAPVPVDPIASLTKRLASVRADIEQIQSEIRVPS